jgi:selenocysteine-specific elongation factor
MDALRALLATEAAAQTPTASTSEGFRMGLDRVFTLDGIGTVVAGSIAAGTVRTGDILCWPMLHRARGACAACTATTAACDVAHAGQRCAVGLAGLDRSKVERGHTLCDPAIALSTQRLDVWLQVAPTESKALRSGTHVHLHWAHRTPRPLWRCWVQASIAPGQGALGTDRVAAARCSCLAWRALCAQGCIGQPHRGRRQVLDALGLARYRQTPERLAYLASQREAGAQQRLAGALPSAPFGIHAAQWLRQSGLSAWPFEPADVPGAVFGKGREWAIATDRLAGNEAAVLAMLADFHARLPEDMGPDIQRARRLALPRMPEALWAALVDQMAGAGRIARRGGFIHLPEHGAQLREAERIVAQRALPLLLEGRFDPPWVRDIAGTARLPEGQVRSVLARLARGGEVFQVVRDLYYHPQVVQQLADLARAIEQREGQVVAASFRDATGLGRKRAIQILEFFDRIGFLRRVGDTHLVRPGTPLFPPGSKP